MSLEKEDLEAIAQVMKESHPSFITPPYHTMLLEPADKKEIKATIPTTALYTICAGLVAFFLVHFFKQFNGSSNDIQTIKTEQVAMRKDIDAAIVSAEEITALSRTQGLIQQSLNVLQNSVDALTTATGKRYTSDDATTERKITDEKINGVKDSVEDVREDVEEIEEEQDKRRAVIDDLGDRIRDMENKFDRLDR